MHLKWHPLSFPWSESAHQTTNQLVVLKQHNWNVNNRLYIECSVEPTQPAYDNWWSVMFWKQPVTWNSKNKLGCWSSGASDERWEVWTLTSFLCGNFTKHSLNTCWMYRHPFWRVWCSTGLTWMRYCICLDRCSTTPTIVFCWFRQHLLVLCTHLAHWIALHAPWWVLARWIFFNEAQTSIFTPSCYLADTQLMDIHIISYCTSKQKTAQDVFAQNSFWLQHDSRHAKCHKYALENVFGK